METKQPLFSPNAKGLIESNNHVDWSAFNILLPWKQQPSGSEGQGAGVSCFVPARRGSPICTGIGHNGKQKV